MSDERPRLRKQDGLTAIAKAYESNLIIRALVSLASGSVPVVGGGIGALDMIAVAKIREAEQKRLRLLFEELATGERELTEDLIQDEDFLYAFTSTVRAALNTRRTEKVKLFARLLLSGVRLGGLGSDEFDEYLSILDELSVRELQIMLILKRFEDAYPSIMTEQGKPESEVQRANRYWDYFETAVATELGIPVDRLRSILTRLQRSGMFEMIAGAYWDYTGGKGRLTPLFSDFAQWLATTAEDAPHPGHSNHP